ncbi:hypothetical protein E4U41_000909 [Claviceps citrina]|nr:hypothetical protein E4U41_000909 [Claviceps citrina]
MHSSTILSIALAVHGVAKAQQISYNGGDGTDETLVGVGYRCYEYFGKVKHVDAQQGVEAVFYK